MRDLLPQTGFFDIACIVYNNKNHGPKKISRMCLATLQRRLMSLFHGYQCIGVWRLSGFCTKILQSPFALVMTPLTRGLQGAQRMDLEIRSGPPEQNPICLGRSNRVFRASCYLQQEFQLLAGRYLSGRSVRNTCTCAFERDASEYPS
jgi:hypothetical protein